MILGAAALSLVACAGEVDDTTGSRLQQPPPGSPIIKPTPAGDITIVGQEVGHAIIDLPEIANATTPPLVEFTGVTSIIVSPVPIDTQPYTDLLRDRLLLITRLKLRFVETTLPPLEVAATKKGKKKAAPAAPPQNTTNPDYQILAELRGRYDADLYKIQVEFVNVQSGAVLFNELYSIRKEAQAGAQPDAGQPVEDSTYEHLPPPPEAGGAPPAAPLPPGASPGVQ
jgi:hypothetical protein